MAYLFLLINLIIAVKRLSSFCYCNLNDFHGRGRFHEAMRRVLSSFGSTLDLLTMAGEYYKNIGPYSVAFVS